MTLSLWFEGPPRSIHRCPSTHALVSSLHDRTASVHLSLRSVLQGEGPASLKRVPHSESVFENAYPSYPFPIQRWPYLERRVI